jgi:hypothetical protein
MDGPTVSWLAGSPPARADGVKIGVDHQAGAQDGIVSDFDRAR